MAEKKELTTVQITKRQFRALKRIAVPQKLAPRYIVARAIDEFLDRQNIQEAAAR